MRQRSFWGALSLLLGAEALELAFCLHLLHAWLDPDLRPLLHGLTSDLTHHCSIAWQSELLAARNTLTGRKEASRKCSQDLLGAPQQEVQWTQVETKEITIRYMETFFKQKK